MLNFKNILCPVEFDAISIDALQLAATLAAENHTTLHILHIARIPPEDMDSPIALAPKPRWEKEATHRLEKLVADALDGRYRYALHVRSGMPDNDIVPVADELGADIIVMATHGRKGLDHMFLGSVVESVTREANCPVLIIRPKATPSKITPPKATPH